MYRFRSFLNKILGFAMKYRNGIYRSNNYRRLIFTTGLFTLSTYYIWQNYMKDPNKISFFTFPITNQSKEKHNFIVNVTKKCAPSVVAIEVKNMKKLSLETGDPMLTSTGSGFVIRENGCIITNAHVIMNKPNAIVNVITTTGETYEATILDIDLKLDLALLKIPCYSLQALPLGKSNDVLTGEWVVALGSPLSLKHTITAGVVSSVNREASDLGFKNNDMKFIQTDATITFGHSGGPLVNLDGEVIGINNLRVTAGIAFAIPIDYVKEFILRSNLHSLENSRVQESMKQPKFGISTLALTEEIVKDLIEEYSANIPINTQGVLIWSIIKNSPAYKAGLKIGDVITEINNISVKSINDFYNILSIFEKELINFTIYREGEKTEVKLKVKDKI